MREPSEGSSCDQMMRIISSANRPTSKRPRGGTNELTYASSGVDRDQRKRSRKGLSFLIRNTARLYKLGEPIELPFGFVFPQNEKRESFIDLQIEGVGTKTLLAEISGKYNTIGIDAVAMAVNDVIRSGARPLLLTDALHIAHSDVRVIGSILSGIKEGAEISDCVVASGETGNVAEILHTPLAPKAEPFDLFVSAYGEVRREDMIEGKISEGDVVIGIESSGIHSNGLTLARKILLKNWGGVFDLEDTPPEIERSVIDELLVPTRIYVRPLLEAIKNSKVKAAIHITGDGFSKFHRILEFQDRFGHNGRNKSHPKLGIRFYALGPIPPVFKLIEGAARRMKSNISRREMFRTFNMGYGYAVVVSKEDAAKVIDSFNKYYPAKTIGNVVTGGSVVVHGAGRQGEKLVV